MEDFQSNAPLHATNLLHPKPPHFCPRCDSLRIAKVIYGLPVFDKRLQTDLVAGRIVLGGFPNRSDNPEYLCLDCDAQNEFINTRPIRQKKSNLKSY